MGERTRGEVVTRWIEEPADFVEAALNLGRRGLRVFPLKAGSKHPPLIKDFPRNATTDEAQIRAWWARWPNANIGVSTNGMLVLDVDPKRGGLASLAVLEAENGPLPATFRVRTPSGGLHLYFTSRNPVACSVDRVAPGIDVRGHGGYVVGPGSVIE